MLPQKCKVILNSYHLIWENMLEANLNPVNNQMDSDILNSKSDTDPWKKYRD